MSLSNAIYIRQEFDNDSTAHNIAYLEYGNNV